MSGTRELSRAEYIIFGETLVDIYMDFLRNPEKLEDLTKEQMLHLGEIGELIERVVGRGRGETRRRILLWYVGWNKEARGRLSSNEKSNFFLELALEYFRCF